MFSPFELSTVFVEAPLRNAPGPYVKPHVVRFVFLSNSFAKFRVCLDVPPIVFVSLNLFDMRTTLSIHVLLNKVLEVCERHHVV